MLESGEACVAWHGFRDGNYDVYLRRCSSTGAWGDVQRLTMAPTIDRHPLPGRSYYYVRVMQEDEELAWSSPVWFGAE